MHVLFSNLKPFLHSQIYDPILLIQFELGQHLSNLSSHSLISNL